jgi:hypothetical protein
MKRSLIQVVRIPIHLVLDVLGELVSVVQVLGFAMNHIPLNVVRAGDKLVEKMLILVFRIPIHLVRDELGDKLVEKMLILVVQSPSLLVRDELGYELVEEMRYQAVLDNMIVPNGVVKSCPTVRMSFT